MTNSNLSVIDITDSKYCRTFACGYFTLSIHPASVQYRCDRGDVPETVPAWYYIYRNDSDMNVEEGQFTCFATARAALVRHAQAWQDRLVALRNS